MTTVLPRRTLFAGCIVAALATPTWAETPQAESPAISKIESANGYDRVMIDFSDLNLNTPSGQQMLRARVFKAAVLLCREDNGAVKQFVEMACHTAIMKSAQPQLAALASRAPGGQSFAMRIEIRRAA